MRNEVERRMKSGARRVSSRSLGDCEPSDDVASPEHSIFSSLRLAFYLPASLAFIFPPPFPLEKKSAFFPVFLGFWCSLVCRGKIIIECPSFSFNVSQTRVPPRVSFLSPLSPASSSQIPCPIK